MNTTKRFFFHSLRFFLKGVFLGNYIGGAYFWQKKKHLSQLFIGLTHACFIFQYMLRNYHQVLLASATGIERYDFTYFKFGAYLFSEYADLREYTTQIAVLNRRPALNTHGMLGHMAGMVVNSSSLYGTLIRHLHHLDNVSASVLVPRLKGSIDFALSALSYSVERDLTSEKDGFLIEIFKVLADYESSALRATQQTGIYLKTLQNSSKTEY